MICEVLAVSFVCRLQMEGCSIWWFVLLLLAQFCPFLILGDSRCSLLEIIACFKSCFDCIASRVVLMVLSRL